MSPTNNSRGKSVKTISPRKKSAKTSSPRNNSAKPLLVNRKSPRSNTVLRWREVSVRNTSLPIRAEFMKLKQGKSMRFDSFSIPMMTYILKIFKGNIPEETYGMNGYKTVPKNLSNTNMKKMPSLLNNIDPNSVKFTVERDSNKEHWYDMSIVYFPVASVVTLYDSAVCCGGKKVSMKFRVNAGEVMIMDSKRYQTPAAKSVAILTKFF